MRLAHARQHPCLPPFVELLAAVARITSGNFRLVQHLFAQIQRIMEINNLSTITPGS